MTLWAIFLLSLILIVSAVSYAYFTANVNISQQEGTLTAGTMRLVFSDNDNGVENKEMHFDESVTKKFTVENTGTLDATAFIEWVDLINTYTSSSLTYTLSYSETENSTYKEVIGKTNVPTSSTQLQKHSRQT